MDDLISRAAAIAQIKENYCDWCDHTDLCKSCETYDCIATIEQHVPAVDAVPVVHARWVRSEDGDGIVCTACGEDYCDMVVGCNFKEWKFCPVCGARMSEG